MEFTHGIRERLSTTDRREEQVEVSTHLPFIPSYPLPSSSSTAFRWHDDSSGAGDCVSTEKEHMFYKVVTPSDVGKLNRLVIPKQQAEKYFPLDTSANEKGLLLSFEDRTGKPWRFRYSYWSSSQSYVMTKGWSRFVKEKGLQAGDTISFGRGVGDAGRHRLFIDWKRRPENRDPPRIPLPELSFARSAGPWSGRLFVPPEAGCGHTWQGHTYPAASLGTGGGQCLCYSLPASRPPQMEVQQAGRSGFPLVLGSPLPLVRNQPAVKRVRLFGVTLDCPESGGGVNYDGHSHSVRVPQLHPGAALPLLQSPGTADAPSPAPSSSNTSAGGRRRYRSLEEVVQILSRSKIDSILDRFIKAMNASSREHDCSSFMEKAGEFLTLREHTTLLPSHVEEMDTATAGPGSDSEVAPNEKKAR